MSKLKYLQVDAGDEVADIGIDVGLNQRLGSLPVSEQSLLLLDSIRGHVAAVTGRDKPADVAPDASWRELGIYREFATTLRQRLSTATGLKLPATLFFDYTTPGALVDHLRAEILGERVQHGAPVAYRRTLHDDPIVIVGMGCRYPGGVRSPDQLWELVASGKDAISELPENRGWDIENLYDPEPGKWGKTYVRHGGFLYDVDQFDPGFFGISPREAAALDPQQRVLLEVSWEAMERAGIDPASVRGSKTGVFVGIAYQDYGPNWHEAPKDFNGLLLMGSLTSAASGRIAYTFGLEGAAVTLDTACSSSLVALHWACQALRTGECSLALAGGATVMATPGVFLEFSCKRGLAPDGRCKSFSADADGTGWAEGAGMLVLERLSDARRNGHQVLAMIAGTALNQDGASNGLTAPNGPSQHRVIRQALANAGLTPDQVDVVEAHGTGTTLGDPIEAQALLSSYGQGRPVDRPLWLGSLKSNIGHSQAAGAVGSVIKMVMAIQHEVLPKTLHASEPSPHVDWSAGAVSLLTEQIPWPETGRPRRAGVSAFGVSGTNGHVIIEEPPAAVRMGLVIAAREPWGSTLLPLAISGKTKAALQAQVEQLRAHCEASPELQLSDVAYTQSRKTQFKHRAVVFAADRAGMLRGLDALAKGRSSPGLAQGVVQPQGKLAVLFSGQGSQRPRMGLALYEAFRPFAAAFDAACAQLDVHLRVATPLKQVIFAAKGSPEAALLDQTLYTQTALFAVEVAHFRLMEAWGLVPDFLIGHSIGELVAAHVSGVLSLADACALVAARGHLMQACRLRGGMVAIQASESEVLDSLVGWETQVGVATVNSPLSTVISGDEGAVLEIATLWETRGRKVKRLRVNHAFHSPHMDELLTKFRRVAKSISFQPETIPIVSNLTGEIATTQQLGSPDYWVQHVRHTVRFLDGMRCLETQGVTAFLELGPDAVLTAMAQDCVSEEHSDRSAFVPTSRSGRPDVETLTTALAELHVRGVDVSWRAAFVGRGAKHVDLPTYAFQYQRYWLEASGLTNDGASATAAAAGLRYQVSWKPIADAIRTLAGTWLVFTSTSDSELVSWLTTGLADRGGRVRLITLEGEVDRERMTSELEKVIAEGVTVGGVLSLLALDETSHPDHPVMTRGLAHNLALAQTWMAGTIDAPLWCATRGAVSVDGSDALTNPAQAMAWGLGRIVGLEHPKRWGGMVDLPQGLDDRAVRDLCGSLSSRDGEDQFALRSSGVFICRLIPAAANAAAPRAWKPRGTVLITGGTGALGVHSARWLAKRGAEHLVLVSRRGLAAPGAARIQEELTALGVTVSIVACDVARRDSVAELLSSLPSEPRLTAVVHAAGVSGRFVALSETSLSEFADVVSGKVAGAVHLDALLGDRPLDAFVLFSSIAGVWGSSTQSAYGAGNAFLDALAHHRRSRGLAATAVSWGPWADDGMASDPTLRDYLCRRGLVPMAASTATPALWQAVADGDTAITITDVDWTQFLPIFVAGRKSHLFDDLPSFGATPEAISASEESSSWARRLANVSESERPALFLELVRTHAAELLGQASPEDVDPTCRFLDLGFDSLSSVELCKRLVNVTGLKMATAVILVEHPTPEGIAGYLRAQAAKDRASGNAQPNLEPGPANGQSAEVFALAESGGTLRQLYRYGCDQNLLDESIDLLKAASKLRPSFRTTSELDRAYAPVQLAEGPGKTKLVCFPPFVCPCGPHNYARIALHLGGLRNAYSVCHPGFGDGEPIPESVDLVVQIHAESLLRQFGDDSLVLAGYSSGGWFAHAVAGHLEALGAPPRGVVLLDSLSLKGERWEKVRVPLRNMAINEQAYALTTDDQLTAMAAYFRMFDGWKPEPIETPTLIVRAKECIPEWAGDRLTDDFWRGSWDLPHSILEVPGDHSTIVNQDAKTTAAALDGWLNGIEVS